MAREQRKLAAIVASDVVGYRFVRGQVIAVVERRDKDSEESFRGTLQRTRWEVIVPELVFAPTNS